MRREVTKADWDKPANSFPDYASSKFEGERLAVALAYEASLDGCGEEDFGDVQEGAGYFCKVALDDSPEGVVCFRECSQGFLYEISEAEFAAELEAYAASGDPDGDESEDDGDGAEYTLRQDAEAALFWLEQEREENPDAVLLPKTTPDEIIRVLKAALGE